jgi:hypothetical protein
MELDLSAAFDKRPRQKKVREPRHEHDNYPTPAPLVEAIVERIAKYAIDAPTRILEPSCGDGEFVAALHKKWPNATVVGVDIRAEVREKIEAIEAMFLNIDFLAIPRSSLRSPDLIITNPPFSLYREFVTHALEGMRDGAIFVLLQRLGHLVGSLEAQAWWQTPMANGITPARQIVSTPPIFPRPSFTGKGTDQTEYCLCIWQKGHDNGESYDPITWEKPASKRGRPRKVVEAPPLSIDAPGDFFANLK